MRVNKYVVPFFLLVLINLLCSRLSYAADNDVYSLIDKLKESTVMILILNEKGEEIPLGSGFIASSNGLIVTAKHVINIDKVYVDNMRCKMSDGEKYKFSILKTNDLQDFAILKIADGKKDFKYLHLGDYSTAKEGDEVLFPGFPLSLPFLTIHKGMISSKYSAKFQV